MTTELTAIRKKLEKKLKEERYIHTLGVMYTAASMAMRHGADVQKAMTAGLLHDCGKYCDVNEQILLCRKHHIKLSDAELEVPALIHARLGAYFAEYEYGITDSEILDAITYHTTGRPAMTMIEKSSIWQIISNPEEKRFRSWPKCELPHLMTSTPLSA